MTEKIDLERRIKLDRRPEEERPIMPGFRKHYGPCYRDRLSPGEFYLALTGRDHVDHVELEIATILPTREPTSHPITLDTSVDRGMDTAYVYVKKLHRALYDCKHIEGWDLLPQTHKKEDLVLLDLISQVDSAYLRRDEKAFRKALQDMLGIIYIGPEEKSAKEEQEEEE